MYKAVVISTLFFLLSFSSFAFNGDSKKEKHALATHIVTLKVVDAETNESLVGVKLEIPDLKISSYSNFDGLIQVEVPKNQVFSIKLSTIGYSERVITSTQAQSSIVSLIEN